jgi:hypothetical protein
VREQVQPRKKHDQLLERVLLNAKMALEDLVARHGRRMHAVLASCARHLQAEGHELQKCERSHDIHISHESFPSVVEFRHDEHA